MKILYFTSDFSSENIEFAKKYGLTMRNSVAVETAQNLEPCDFVFGDETPENYRQTFLMFTLPENTAQTVAIETYQALQAELETAQARIAELEAQLAEKSKLKKQAN
ncbi:hypothetical protein [Wielerella bovis]|uniref:hypothetical protein n=1 Tax=Wielerella bovis TaxID=2917790 RepID=UPI002018B541|nr:hypothetical protein [Wielerella bovis]MCG7657125.1 hypothetical protein [Wielerella bovis]MCG7659348.1 hypothetical protein [Wielerella bovis]ULJ64055.1 hypothetical protein MIS33_07755 [Wielerella bovis]ULJ67485.1 hypothetical protein MIS31_02710 [Wielerella bovis]